MAPFLSQYHFKSVRLFFFFFFLEANDLAAVAEAKPRQNSMLNGVIPFTDF